MGEECKAREEGSVVDAAGQVGKAPGHSLLQHAREARLHPKGDEAPGQQLSRDVGASAMGLEGSFIDMLDSSLDKDKAKGQSEGRRSPQRGGVVVREAHGVACTFCSISLPTKSTSRAAVLSPPRPGPSMLLVLMASWRR